MTQSYLDVVHDLQTQLDRLTEAIAAPENAALPQPPSQNAKDWRRSHQQIQEFFQAQMVNTTLEVTPQYLSLQVEIDKQLKMLGMDLTMLQTARQASTWQKRHQQIGDRLGMLKRYCQMHQKTAK